MSLTGSVAKCDVSKYSLSSITNMENTSSICMQKLKYRFTHFLKDLKVRKIIYSDLIDRYCISTVTVFPLFSG